MENLTQRRTQAGHFLFDFRNKAGEPSLSPNSCASAVKVVLAFCSNFHFVLIRASIFFYFADWNQRFPKVLYLRSHGVLLNTTCY